MKSFKLWKFQFSHLQSRKNTIFGQGRLDPHFMQPECNQELFILRGILKQLFLRNYSRRCTPVTQNKYYLTNGRIKRIFVSLWQYFAVTQQHQSSKTKQHSTFQTQYDSDAGRTPVTLAKEYKYSFLKLLNIVLFLHVPELYY